MSSSLHDQTREIWFYRFPDEMPLYVPVFCKNEQEARAHVRRMYNLKRIPIGAKFWVEEIGDHFRDIRDSEVHRLSTILKNREGPHKILGQGELSILVGPVEMRFDREGKFTQMNWCDTGGPSDYHVIIRGEEP